MAMLISKFHKLIQSKIIWYIIIACIVISFAAVFGSPRGMSMSKARAENAAGTLHGQPVDSRTYAEARGNTYLAIIMALGRQIQITPQIDRQIREAAWERIAALDEAKRLGITGTDDEVFQAIQSHEGFQTQGQFNKAAYKAFITRFLNQIGFTERQFESYIREEILLQKLRIVINRAVLVSPAEIQRMFHSISDKFRIEYCKIGPELVMDEVKITKEDARTFFEKDPTYFTIPEKVKVKYVRIAAAPYMAQAKITDEDIKTYYEDNADDFLNDTNEVEAATNKLDEAQAAKATNEVSAAASNTPAADATSATTGATETAATTNAAASTNAFDFSSLTNDTFSPVSAEEPKSKYKPLEDVKDDIREKLEKKAALDMAADKAMEFVAALAPDREGHAATFDDVAKTNGFLIEQAGPFHEREKLLKIDAGLGFNQAAFNLQPGPDSYVSYPVRGSNYVYVIAIEDRIPERVPEFDEVASDVLPIAKERAVVDAVSTKAKEVRDAVEKAVKEGKTLGDAVAKYGLEAHTTEEFTASSGIEDEPDYSKDLMRGILTLNQGEVSEPIPATDAILIAHVIERSAGDPTTFESLKAQIVNSMRRQNGRFVYDAWQKNLLKDAGFKSNDLAALPEDEEEEAATNEEPAAERERPRNTNAAAAADY